MNKTLNTFLVIPVTLALLLGGCSLEDPESPTDLRTPTGSQVFRNYVAVGNSLTAGYMDSGLQRVAQQDGFTTQIARAIGHDEASYTMPWVSFPGIGSTDVGNPALVAGSLHFNGTGITPVGVTPAAEVMGLLENATQPAPYHNLGVPGAWAADVLSAYSAATSVGQVPFFDFINRASLYGTSPDTVYVADADGVTPKQVIYQTASTGWQAITKGPTLATLWIGNNDILFGATGGNPTAMNMTHPDDFAGMFSDMLQLLAGGLVERTGFPPVIAVGNIPGITSAAYFIDQDTFEAATGQAGGWPGGTEEAGVVLYTFPVLSWTTPSNAGNPVPAEYTLTAQEAGLVDAYVTGYNQYIAGIAAAVTASGMARVGVVDCNAVLAALPQPAKTHFMLLLPQMGGDIDAAAATTMFSLDGVHPNNRGYGVVANAFIDVINQVAGSDVAPVNLDDLVWDPTYGQDPTPPTKVLGVPRLSPEAAAQMTAIWRR